MKIFLKRNFLFLLSFFIFLLVGLSSFINCVRNDQNSKLRIVELQSSCINGEITNEDMCATILDENYQTTDFYYMYWDLWNSGMRFLPLYAILFVIVPSLYYSSRYLKNKMILQDLTRKSYGKVKKAFFLSAYKSSLIIPMVYLILFLLCFIYIGNFTESALGIFDETPKYPVLMFGVFFINLFIHGVVYVNLGLIILRKHHNFIVTSVLTYILFFTIELCGEVILEGIIFKKVLHTFRIDSFFSLMNIYVNYVDMYCIIFPIILLLLTGIIIYFKYRNKEKLIIDCEGGKE